MKKITVTQIDENNAIVQIGGAGIGITTQELKKLHSELKKALKTESKYNSKKVFAHDRYWDSVMELDFYEFLLQNYAKEQITIQPRFVLQDKQKSMREIGYNADFRIGNVVYDVKGMVLPTFAIKLKMFKVRYPALHLALITRCPKYLQEKYGRWIDVGDLKKERRLAKKASKN